MRLAGLAEVDGTPILSDNVEHLANIPGTVGISGCFMQTDELFVTSGLESVRVYDVSDGTNPTQVGVLPSALFENEAMNCGERVIDGKRQRFALIGVDLFQAIAGRPAARQPGRRPGDHRRRRHRPDDPGHRRSRARPRPARTP